MTSVIELERPKSGRAKLPPYSIPQGPGLSVWDDDHPDIFVYSTIVRHSATVRAMKFWTTTVSLLTLAAAPAVNAHHSRANFLLDDTITIEGTILDYTWKNPHVFLEIQTTDSDLPWLVEAHSVTGLVRLGWNSKTFAAGDLVVITGNPDRDPDRRFVLLDHIINDQGETLYSFRRPEDRGQEAQAPGNVIPSEDFSGTWSMVFTLRQALVGGFVPPKDWPLSKAGQALTGRFTPDDNPAYDCISSGVPRMVLAPYLIRWSRHADRIEIVKEHSEFTRIICLDEDGHLEGLTPGPLGHSIGNFQEDGTLVVDTTDLTPARWGLATGLDSSDELHVTETYMLTNGGLGMDVSYTITDPVYLSAPVTVSGRYRKVPDSPLTPFECDLDAARRHLTVEG